MSSIVLPAMVLQTAGQWPPARDGHPAGTAEVGSWSVDREIVASTLPGNIRARTGLSVGTGSATIGQATTPLTPWAKDPKQRVAAGTRAKLVAETPSGLLSIGSWVTGETTGSLLSAEVGVALIEAQAAGKRGRNALRPGLPTDPGVLVASLARECGFHAVPPAVAGALWSWPVAYGVDQHDAGTALIEAGNPVWSTLSGALGASGVVSHAGAGNWPSSVYVTANIAPGDAVNWTTFQFGDLGPVGCNVAVAPWSRAIAVRVGAGAQVHGTWPAGTPDPLWPSRIQLEIKTTRNASTGRWTGITVRVRASRTSPWSAPVTASGTATTVGTTFSVLSPGVAVSGVQVTTTPDNPALYEPPTANIEPLGGAATGGVPRWVEAATSPWDAIQAICGAHLAAGWVDRTGRFTAKGRQHLAGLGTIAQTVTLEDRVEDLAWSIDPADTGDRLEVTYRSGGLVAPPGTAATVWSASEKLYIDPGRSIELEIPLEGPVDLVQQWIHAALIPPGTNIDTYPHCIFSAMTAESGGSAIHVLSFEFHTRRVSAGMATVTILNKSAGRAWLVDANGAACVIVKGVGLTKYDVSQVASRGVSADLAVSTVTVDLGHWASTTAMAEEITDWIWGRMSTPSWKAGSVRVLLDLSLDIGQVVRLEHPDTGLSVKAFITRVSYAGSPGEIAQTLDVVLIPPTWSEFDTAWAGRTWAQFDALWAGQTWSEFDAVPLTTP